MESKLKELKLQKEKKKSRKLIDQFEDIKFVQEERFDLFNSRNVIKFIAKLTVDCITILMVNRHCKVLLKIFMLLICFLLN